VWADAGHDPRRFVDLPLVAGHARGSLRRYVGAAVGKSDLEIEVAAARASASLAKFVRSSFARPLRPAMTLPRRPVLMLFHHAITPPYASQSARRQL